MKASSKDTDKRYQEIQLQTTFYTVDSKVTCHQPMDQQMDLRSRAEFSQADKSVWSMISLGSLISNCKSIWEVGNLIITPMMDEDLVKIWELVVHV